MFLLFHRKVLEINSCGFYRICLFSYFYYIYFAILSVFCSCPKYFEHLSHKSISPSENKQTNTAAAFLHTTALWYRRGAPALPTKAPEGYSRFGVSCMTIQAGLRNPISLDVTERMCASPLQNSYVEALTPTVAAFGDGASKEIIKGK